MLLRDASRTFSGRKTIARLLLFLAALPCSFSVGIASEPIFPEGSKFGLVPPSGFTLATDFRGFISPDIGGSIVIEELPSTAFKHFQKQNIKAAMARIGVTIGTTNAEKFGDLNGIAIIGHQTLRSILFLKCMLFLEGTDATAVISLQIPQKNIGAAGHAPCAALTTVVERREVRTLPLPFELTNMGGMRKTKNQTAGGVVLTAGSKDLIENAEQPLLLISPSLGAVPKGNKADVSRNLLHNFTALGNAKIVSESSLLIDGAPSTEIIASGTFGRTDMPIVVVQWIRFSKERYIRMIGLSAANRKNKAFAAFHRVRDGLRAK